MILLKSVGGVNITLGKLVYVCRMYIHVHQFTDLCGIRLCGLRDSLSELMEPGSCLSSPVVIHVCPILCMYQDETQTTGILFPLCASAFHKMHRSKRFCGAPSQGLKQPDTPDYKLSLSLDSESNLPVWSALRPGIGLPFRSDCQERHSKCKLFFYPSS